MRFATSTFFKCIFILVSISILFIKVNYGIIFVAYPVASLSSLVFIRYSLFRRNMLNTIRLLLGISLLVLLATGHSLAQTGPNPAAPTSPLAPAAIRPDSVFINPEVLPQFVGGDKAFMAYLSKNIHYPQQALQRRVSGRVMVNFILSVQGRVQDAHVVSGPGNGLNDEALRLVWLMPAWEPARSNGQPVRVACTVPITFNTER